MRLHINSSAGRRAGAALAVLALTTLAGSPAGALPHRSACLPLTIARSKVHAAAVRRESSLGVLVAALSARKDPWSMNAGQVSALQSANSGISTLDAHVQSACYSTVAALRADVTPLFTTYRVYWLRVPQTRGIEAADRFGEARSRLGQVASRLQALVGSNAKAQADLASMNQAIAAADARLGTQPTPAADIGRLATLAPAADMTADVAAMETARADLFGARTSLVEARVDGLRVVADLGG